jgi:hypothetical protein
VDALAMKLELRSPWVRAAGLGLAGAILFATARPRPAHEEPLLLRLFGPAAELAAKAQWVRFDLALRAGELELAYERAETALWIDPGSTEGWTLYAAHLCFDRAAPEREPDVAVRRAWFEAALATLARGEAVARSPSELALYAGLMREDRADTDSAVTATFGAADGTGGSDALLRAAAEDYDRAARLGHPRAAELAEHVRSRTAR